MESGAGKPWNSKTQETGDVLDPYLAQIQVDLSRGISMNEESLFNEALPKPPAERAGFLDAACAGQPQLRAAVEALLTAFERSGNEFDQPPSALGQSVESELGQTSPLLTGEYTPVPAAVAPQLVTTEYQRQVATGVVIGGRYSLQERLGEGGMGEVWIAKQTEPVKRRVALKLIKAGMDTKAVLQRFDAERQALAMMEHPNIARVIDGGMTAERRPFFVMELVNGLPLTKFCDQAKLSIRERLELFAAICQAVQHAHQKGIIHRDLKPSNILVTLIDGRPVPKVIDFGVAKAIGGKLLDESLSTQFGAVVGTFEYMSPEQAEFSGEDIDTRSDIYSLGVILYELLTGVRPIDAALFKEAALTEMIRIIREEEPSKPSTRLSTDGSLPSLAALRQTEPRKLMTMLRGELDWVVMKCLEKERDRRYETANGLARDIQRYLADEVVEARPPTAGYRLRKFASRHRGQVVAACMVLLSLMLGMVGTTWGMIRAARANTALAAANADLTAANTKVQARYNLAVDAIKTFHTGVSEDFLLKQNQFKELRDRLLKSAADFYDKLSALLGNEADDASRRALAAANFELADLTDKVGRKEEALARHRAVLAARKALASGPEADVETSADVGRSGTAVGTLLEGIGKTAAAVATYREAEALLAARAASDPSARQVRAALADCRSRLGYLLYNTGHADEGLLVLRQARSNQEVLAGAPEATTEARRELANTINRIGILLARTGRQSEADVEYHNALAIYQKLAEENPANSEFRRRLGFIYNNLGGLLMTIAGRSSASQEAFRAAMAIKQKLADDNPAVTEFLSDLALSHRNLGEVLSQAGRASESEVEYRKAMPIFEKLVEENQTVSEFRGSLADSHSSLALLLHQTGRTAEGQAEFQKALAIRQKLADESPTVTKLQSDLARSRHNLGYLLSESGRPREAEVEYRKALAINQKLADDGPSVTEFRAELANNHLDLGILLSETGRQAESEAEQRKAISLYQKLSDDNPKNLDHRVGLAGALYFLGDVSRALHRPAEAREDYERAISIHERLVKESANPWYRSLLAQSLRRRGLARIELGDIAGGAADTRRALSLFDGLASRSGEEQFGTACCRAALAGLAERDGAKESAAAGKAEATHAMALLRTAVDTGYRNLAPFQTESSLDPLRKREDFKKLVEELERKSSAKPEKSP
jgi:eukaryotic-like serine/threonine-protein kinase